MRLSEGNIQDAIRIALGSVDGLLLYRNNVGFDLEHRVRYGVGNPGGADLIGCYRGRFVAVEIKTPTGRQSEDQRRFQRCVERAGGIYVVLRSVEEAAAWIATLAATTATGATP